MNKFIKPQQKHSAPVTPPKRQTITELHSETHFEFPNRGVSQDPPVSDIVAPLESTKDNPVDASSTPTKKSYAETNPDYVSISLPSRFNFYTNKEIATRTLLAAHQAKFSRAHKENKYRYTVEAISACLEPGVSAFDLTPGDFYFLMYWQRVQSFSKTPMLITAFCQNEDHNHSVYIGDETDIEGVLTLVKKDEDTLRNEQLVNMTTLDTKYLDNFVMPDLEVTKKFPVHVETMRWVVDSTEFLQDVDDITEEQLFLLQYAGFLSYGPERQTVLERLAIAGTMTPDDLAEMDKYIEAVTDYGVSEYANLKCKECSASIKVRVPFDALTFLPGRGRA